jgi:transcriptional regulator with XRE-family HTH domain
LWQGCGKNPDFTAKTDITDKFHFNRISNLRVCNGPRLHPAYRLIRHKVFERKEVRFYRPAIVAQTELAVLAGMSASKISVIEKSDRNITFATAVKIANALACIIREE